MTERQRDACEMLLRQETSMVEICRASAVAGVDLSLKELYEDMAARHKTHCKLLKNKLQEVGSNGA